MKNKISLRKKNALSAILLAAFAALAVFFDLLSKYLISARLELFERVDFLPGFLSIYRVPNNDGAAYSLFSGMSVPLIIITFLFLFVFLFYFFSKRQKSPLFGIGGGLVVGGALGNLYDRLFLGGVRDFLSFDFVEFPTFNVADCCICVGVVLLAVYLIFILPKESAEDKKFFALIGQDAETPTQIDTSDLDAKKAVKFDLKKMLNIKKIKQEKRLREEKLAEGKLTAEKSIERKLTAEKSAKEKGND